MGKVHPRGTSACEQGSSQEPSTIPEAFTASSHHRLHRQLGREMWQNTTRVVLSAPASSLLHPTCPAGTFGKALHPCVRIKV